MNRQAAPSAPVPKVVLDTNSVLDMLLFEDAEATGLVVAIERAHLKWLGTARMREEVAGVLQRSRMGRWAPPQRAETVLAFVDHWMRVVPAPRDAEVPRCRDSADQIFIDLAWAEQSEWLLTRDKALLKLARPALSRGVQICTPATWSAAWGAPGERSALSV